MRLTVQYWAQAQAAAGVSSEVLQLDAPCTVPQLLAELARRHGPALQRVVLGADGRPHPSLVLLVGDQQVAGDDSRILADGETLAIVPPIAGG